MRVLEFMRDYDKLRSGRIPATSFAELWICVGLVWDKTKWLLWRKCLFVVCVCARTQACIHMLL